MQTRITPNTDTFYAVPHNTQRSPHITQQNLHITQLIYIIQQYCCNDMMLKSLLWTYACVLQKKCCKKIDMSRFFVVILSHFFYVLLFSNIQLTVFLHDDDLFNRRIITLITFITFIAIRHWYFSFDSLFLCFLSFYLHSSNKSAENIYHLFLFLFYIQNRV